MSSIMTTGRPLIQPKTVRCLIKLVTLPFTVWYFLGIYMVPTEYLLDIGMSLKVCIYMQLMLFLRATYIVPTDFYEVLMW